MAILLTKQQGVVHWPKSRWFARKSLKR